jgi:hypothetical protein
MPKALLTNPTEIGKDKEWLIHRFHAMLGAFVLGHFIYRYVLFFFGNVSDMGFDDTSEQLLLFLPHALLQISGFSFKLPPKRHPEGNRIWTEYRWHGLLFFCRSMAFLSMAQGCQSGNFACRRGITRFLSTVILIMNMLCVDSVTLYFKSRGESSSTIRGLKGPPMVKYFMSATQFHVNVNCLLKPTKSSVQFAALSVVQGSAFGMTLRRKCLINHSQGLFLYAMVLLFGMLVVVDDLQERGIPYAGVAIGNVAAMIRIDLRLNKYILWSFVSSAILPIVEQHGDHSLWKVFAVASTIGLLINGRRHQKVVHGS